MLDDGDSRFESKIPNDVVYDLNLLMDSPLPTSLDVQPNCLESISQSIGLHSSGNLVAMWLMH